MNPQKTPFFPLPISKVLKALSGLPPLLLPPAAPASLRGQHATQMHARTLRRPLANLHEAVEEAVAHGAPRQLRRPALWPLAAAARM